MEGVDFTGASVTGADMTGSAAVCTNTSRQLLTTCDATCTFGVEPVSGRTTDFSNATPEFWFDLQAAFDLATSRPMARVARLKRPLWDACPAQVWCLRASSPRGYRARCSLVNSASGIAAP